MDVSLMLLVSVLCILSPVHSEECELTCHNGGTVGERCMACYCTREHKGRLCELDEVMLTFVVDSPLLISGLAFDMTCKITNARGFGLTKSDVQFKLIYGDILPVYFWQKGSKCTVHVKVQGYIAKCGTGTDDVSSDVKIYTVQISRARKDHANDWTCFILYPIIPQSSTMHMRPAGECGLTCLNGGTPLATCSGCICSSGFIGPACGECGITCSNGGTLLENCTECICPSGFKGPTCGQSEDEESSGPGLVLIVIICFVCLFLLLLIIIIIIIFWRTRRQRPAPVDRTLVPQIIEPSTVSQTNVLFGDARSKRRVSKSSSREGRRPSTSKKGSDKFSKKRSHKSRVGQNDKFSGRRTHKFPQGHRHKSLEEQ
ncbi:neurogenic locus notch homolog protein 2-like isoform X3 [Gigantopelta aegis]|uniref:neurogenic locus notch homolog protein 2-like isoform X3 n=1 Tax=Gigantopelta aegis TaxID=1735272 RepID=UPI001B88A47E|nr:neurogenic locus notch homolog protein 2-like isoform X3 [Gigantopelta aegis]